MAFGITAPSQPAATQGAPIDQLSPRGPSSTLTASMTPDTVKRSNASSSGVYYEDMLRRAGADAHALAAANIMDATEPIGPALGQLGAKVGLEAFGIVRAAAPIVGEVGGAAGLVLLSLSPAGESDADLAKTRAIDAAGHQRMTSMAHLDAMQPQRITFPGQPIDVGPSHTTHPSHMRDASDGMLRTPAETQTKPARTGHAAPNFSEVTKPTGTAIHQPRAADHATVAEREKVVGPEHAPHLKPSGTLANADKALIDVDKKINGYALNPEHAVGTHKARVFKSALGYDKENSQSLVDQIREGVQTQPAVPGRITKFGTQFGVDIPVTGPSGSATVRTGWNYDPGSNVPRLTTAVVKT